MMTDQLRASDGEIPIPEGVYPLNWDSSTSPSMKTQMPHLHDEENTQVEDEYPDFNVWKQKPEEDAVMKSHLQKGYMDPQLVAHEDQSGRQLIVTELFSKPNGSAVLVSQQRDEKLDLLGQIFIDAMHKRKVFNTLKSHGVYKPPPRVTLTEHKKETWLKKLATPSIPLRELSRAIPHGLRNKVLLEQCMAHKIPIPRAIWLIKCISTNEQRQLKRKNGNLSTVTTNVNKWIVEWTEQITSFFESVIEACFDPDTPKENSRFRLNYITELISNLYSDDLMSRITFLTWIVRFTAHLVNNSTTFTDLKPLLIHQYNIKLFWFKIIKFDYLSKELSESMLLTLLKANQLSKGTKFDSISQKLCGNFQPLIKYLFYNNSDIFILPSNWNYLKPWLKKVLDMNLPPVSDQFNLISYRNESLTIDEFDISLPHSNKPQFINPHDNLSLILYKLDNCEKEGESFPTLSKLIFDDSNSEGPGWKSSLDLIFQWCIESFREKRTCFQRIVLVCSILQFRLSQLIQLKSKKYKQFRLELETKITDFVYMMSEILNYNNKKNPKGNFYDVNNFLILIRSLFTIKLFVVSSYLRRLIASGVIYLSEPDRTCYIHILILNSLPASNDPNMKSILKRLTDSTNMQIINQDINDIKVLKLKLLDDVLESDSDITYIDEKFPSTDIFKDPIQIGRHLELNELLWTQLDKFLKAKDKQVILTYKKVLVLYGLFENNFTGLCAVIVSIFDALNIENPKIKFADDDAFVLFLKLAFLNYKFLKNSIFNIKINMLDHCLLLISQWIDTKRYNIIQLLHLANLPKKILKKIPKFHDTPDLINASLKLLTPEELALIEVSSYDRLSNGAEFFHYATFAINKYSNFIRGGDEIIHNTLIIKFLKSLQYMKNDEFSKCIFNYLIRSIKPTLQLDYEGNLKLIMRLVIDGFIDIKKVLDIFDYSSSENLLFESNDSYSYLSWDLFFGLKNDFDYNENILYEFSKLVYILDHPYEFYKIISQGIYSAFQKKQNIQPTDENMVSVNSNTVSVNVDPVDIAVNVDPAVNVDVMGSFHDLNDVAHLEDVEHSDSFSRTPQGLLNTKVIDAFWELLSCHLNVYLEYIQHTRNEHSELDFHSLTHFMFNKVLNIETEMEINETDIFENLNHLNLILMQWLFKLSIKEKYKDRILSGKDVTSSFVSLIESIPHVIKMDDKNYRLIGELFFYLEDACKHKILSACEEIYLNSESFPKVVVGNVDITGLISCIISTCSRLRSNCSTRCICCTGGHKNTDKVNNDVNDNINKETPTSVFSPREHNGIVSPNPGTDMNNSVLNPSSKPSGTNAMNELRNMNTQSKIKKDSAGMERDDVTDSSNKVNLGMTDEIVFSLNTALEKLIHICNHIEHQKKRAGNKFEISKELELGIKMVSRIILLHRYFLVEMILKRSVNLQRDVLIMNLLKLFNHKIMLKDPKLKNLLYDVLISIKAIISEYITEQFQKSQTISTQPTTLSPGMWISKGTPTTNLFLSPMNSPKPSANIHSMAGATFSATPGATEVLSNNDFKTTSNDEISGNGGSSTKSRGKFNSAKMKPSTSISNCNNNTRYSSSFNSTSNTSYIIMPNILNIKPPSFNNNLRSLLSMFDLRDTVPERETRLYLVNQNWDGTISDDEILTKYFARPFEQIEDSSPRNASTESAIGLQLFGMSAKKENPK